MHSDEVRVTTEVAARLVAEQFPRWAHLPVEEVRADGTQNAIHRLGDRLAARFPLRTGDRGRLVAEAAAARELAGHSPVPTPEPVAIGEPGCGYPFAWAVQTWVPGAVAGTDNPAGVARDLAAFVRVLRGVDTRGRTWAGPGRGGHLPDHDDWLRTCFRESAGLLDVRPLEALWRRFRELPRGGPDVMSHKDLIPGNVLVADGRLAGVLDGGGFGPADPALDLVAAWHLFDDGPRAGFRDALGCDDLEWARGGAWAFQQAMGLVWYYVESSPELSRLGRRTLGRLTDEFRPGR